VALVPFAPAQADSAPDQTTYICQDPRLQHETPGAPDSYHTKYRPGELFPLREVQLNCLPCAAPRRFSDALERAAGADWRTRVRLTDTTVDLVAGRPASPA